MLCQKCKVRPASVHITKIVNGKKVERHLCGVCAVEEGFLGAGAPGVEFGFPELPGFFEFPDLFASFLKRRPTERYYDYFSESANRILQLASEEATRLGHDHVRTEHLLLGLIKSEGLATKVLQSLGVDLVNLFSDIESLIGRGKGSPKKLTLSPRAKKALELAYQAARELGFNYVGEEHILLGIIREGESIAAQALQKRKVNFDKVAREIVSEAEKAIGPSGPKNSRPNFPKAAARSSAPGPKRCMVFPAWGSALHPDRPNPPLPLLGGT